MGQGAEGGKRFSLVSQGRPGTCHDLSSAFDLAWVFFAAARELLVGSSSLETRHDIVHCLVYVELFAAENVDERGTSIRESVYADVALGDYDEAADPPFFRVVFWTVDESVGRSDLVHRDNVRELV